MWFRPSHRPRRRDPRAILADAAHSAVELLEGRVFLAATPAAQARGPLSTMGATLAETFRQYEAQLGSGKIDSPANFKSADQMLHQSKGRIQIEAYARPGHAALLEAAFGAVKASGIGRIGNAVSGYVSVHKLDDLAGNPHLQFARPVMYVTNVGATTSQGGQADRADIARSTYGINGAGVKVGVISDSFDTGPGSYASDVSSGDLPSGVQVIEDTTTAQSDEGRAMLQLVHDAAPGAALAFATGHGGEANFANNIRLLKNAGAKVIVDDLIYLSEPMFQDGLVAQAVDEVVAGGVSYFSSAGNNGRNSYESTFRPGAVRSPSSIPSTVQGMPFFGGRAHDFDPGAGVDEFQSFTLAAGATIDLQFQWDTPFFSANATVGADTEMDIYVLNSAGTQIIGGAASANQGNDGYERVVFQNTTGAAATFNLMLVYDQTLGGTTPTRVKYVNFGSALGAAQFATNSGTAYGHTNAAGASSVAAAFWADTPAFGVNPPVVESFSSAGGTPILISPSGTRLGSAQTRQTPDITAADGGNTTFFGQDVGGSGEPDTFPNFFGTSAAAPEAAAVAALLLQAKPTLTPAQVYTALQTTAVDMDDPTVAGTQTGYDDRTGFGLIRADAAVASVVTASTGLIAGKTFHDFDNDGTLDAGETPLSGVTVNLDRDDNGSVDATAVSNATGDYSFTGLTNATYRLTETPPSGFAVRNTHQVFINAGQSFTGVNFSNRPTGDVVFTGTAGADTYLLRRAAAAANYEILIGGVLTHVVPASGVTSITFDLLGGSDALTLDYVNAAPIPSGGFVRYDGGDSVDADSLTVNGSVNADTISLVNPTMQGAVTTNAILLANVSGPNAVPVESITVNGGAGADTLTTGVSLPGALTYDGGSESDSLVYYGTFANDTIDVTTTGITRSTQQFAHSAVEAVTVNGDFGFDTINVTSTLPTTVNGGDGTDTVVYSGTAAQDTINLNNQTVQRVGAAGALQVVAEALVINGLGDSDTINAATSGGPTTVTLDGGSEADTFNVTPSSTALFRVIGGAPTAAPGDTLNLTLAGATGQTFDPAVDANGYQQWTFTNRMAVKFKEIETGGQPPHGSIGGRVYHDHDHDFTLEAGEPGMAGVFVYLDNNNNQVFDAGDASTTTDGNGDYLFSGLADGSYRVRITAPTGYVSVSGHNPIISNGGDFLNVNPAVVASVYNGTAGADDYLLRIDPTNSLKYQIFVGGALAYTVFHTVLSSIAFNLGDGDDSLTLDYVNGSPMHVGGITYNGGTGTNGAAALLTTGGDSVTVNATQYVSGGRTLNFANTGAFTIDGRAGGDVFAVTPAANTLFRVIGGDPTTAPGDTLNITHAGATQTGNVAASSEAGFEEVSYGNRRPVRFTQIETVSGIEEPPTVGGLTDTPDPVAPGETLTLTATGVADANGGTLTTTFYRETNGVTGLQVGADTQVGSDAASPYSVDVAAPLETGTYTYYAQASDVTGRTSNVVQTTTTVAIIDVAPPTVTEVFVRGTAWAAGFNSFIESSGAGEATFGYRLADTAHADELPWVNLNQISVRFSEDVDVTADALVLRGVRTATYAGLEFAYDPTSFTATWTIPAAAAAPTFMAEKLLIDLNADAGGVRDRNGNALDGEWTNPTAPATGGDDTFPSGNGTAGGDFHFRLNVLPGDADRTGGVTGADVALVRSAQGGTPGFGLYTIFKDLDGTGGIVGADVALARSRQGSTLPAGEPAAPLADTSETPTSMTAVSGDSLFATGPTVQSAMQELGQEYDLLGNAIVTPLVA